MKRKIRLTENDLHRIVENSVKKILKEGNFFPTTKCSITDPYADELFKVDIHIENDGNDIANGFFDDEDEAYNWAEQQIKLHQQSNDERVLAEIYGADNEGYELSIDDLDEYSLGEEFDWSWIDCLSIDDCD